MSRIRSGDTRPEKAVRSLFFRLGYRFRLNRRDLPGKPDLVLPRYKLAVFVHGCFWHRHEDCRFAYTPKSRQEFWTAKFRDNVARDYRVHDELTAIGWRVMVIWECELKDPAALAARIRSCLAGLEPSRRFMVSQIGTENANGGKLKPGDT